MVEGSVILHWQQCAGESFHYYKVVRSRNANPSYLPFTDGTQVVAVIENGEVVEFVDPGVDGGTWYYRVQSIGYAGEAKVLLGQTPVKSVTIE